jgi:hypothetical protein
MARGGLYASMDVSSIGKGITMDVLAKTVRFENDGYCTVLAFADDPNEPRQYAILQVTNHPSDQDVKLGQGGVHLELGGYGVSGYNLLSAIEPVSNGVLLTLDDRVANEKGIGHRVSIELQRPFADNFNVVDALRTFQERLSRGL